MKKNIAVLGIGLFGHELALRLSKMGHHVLAVDKNRDVINAIKDEVTEAIVADAASDEVLKEIDIANFDVVVLGMSSNFENIVLALTYVKKFGAKKVLVKASTEIQKEILLKIGADIVVLPEKEIASEVAERISSPHILKVFDIEGEVKLLSVRVPSKFVGKTLQELDLRKKHGISVVMAKKEGEKARLITDPFMHLDEGDELIVGGDETIIHRVFA